MSWVYGLEDCWYTMRFRGGPEEFDVTVNEGQYEWPAPGIIKGSDPGGHYVKDSEQEFPAQQPGGYPIRFVSYYWRKL